MDTINARNGKNETVDCGLGKKDVATVDKKDKVKGCEKVKRANKQDRNLPTCCHFRCKGTVSIRDVDVLRAQVRAPKRRRGHRRERELLSESRC
jgi:hypothetical protein